jgi:Undecaprenyl-phosphate glucose phosphotransferase
MYDTTLTSPATSAGLPPLADFRLNYRATSIPPVVLLGLTRLADVLLIALMGAALYFLYVEAPSLASGVPYFAIAGAVGLGVAAIFQAVGLYTLPGLRAPISQLSRLALGWTSIFAAVVAAVFFLKVGPDFSRVWLAAWYVGGAIGIASFRAGLAGLIRGWTHDGRLIRRAVVVGGGEEGTALLQRLETEDTDLRICGVFDDRSDVRVGSKIAGYPKLGAIADLADFSRGNRVDVVLVALPQRAEDRLYEILRDLMILPLDIKLSSLAAKLRLRPRAYSYIGAVPFLDVADRPIADWAVIQKWLFDRVIGILALVALSPVMLLTALAIKLDSKGPVFFKQKRYGFNNELIEVYKFRSMFTDKSDASASKLVTRGDPRVTGVGRFIRKASIDELPQLFNVLKGELSLVGPRPHALQAKAADKLYPDAVDGYFARHKVKPGLTGWAQINGWRGETDTQEKIVKRVEHDLYYIDHWSVVLDLYILFKTPFAMLSGENAY